MSYTSQNPYGGPVNMPEQRGPDINSAGLPARQLAQGLAEVAGQWAGFWAQAEQAKAVSAASSATATASMELGDMVLGFEKDPDPAGVPDRFKQRLADWKTQKLEGLSPQAAQLVGRWIDRAGAASYNQINASASRRVTQELQAQAATDHGAHAQRIAAAPDQATADAELQALKASIAGNVQGGVIPRGDAQTWFSRSMAQAISIKAAKDPIGAQQMLDRHKAEMDAGTVATLTGSLRGPVERREDENDVQQRITLNQDVRTRADAVVQGLMARGLPQHVAQGLAANAIQESGANPATRPGDGGASDGLFQWRDSRRQAFKAQYGIDPSQATLDQQLDFTVAELQGSEKRAGDALLATRTPEDAARVGSTAYLRPRDTAVEERRRAGYATALAGGSPRQMVLDQVRQDSADMPLGRRLHRETLVEQWFNRLDAQQGQQRAALGSELRDLSATYLAGNTTPAIPENRIRELHPADSQRIIDSLNITRTAGDALKASAFASPADQTSMRAQLAGNPADTYLAADRQQAVEHYDQGLTRIRTAIKDDPGGYAGTAPEVQELVRAGATAPQIMAASIGVQQRMGVLPSARRLLTNDQATVMAELLRTTPPEKADMAATLGRLAQDFGAGDADPARRATGAALFNAALGELVKHQKIGWEWIAFAGMDRPEQAQGRAMLQQALVFEAARGGPEAVVKLLPQDQAKALPGELDSALTDLRTVTSHHPGGMALFDNSRRSIETIARMRVMKGESASQAAKNAYNDVIGHKWEPAGDDGSGWMFDTHTMLVPKGQAGAIETSLATVRGGIKPGDIMPLPDPMRRTASEAELRDATASAARRGFWINNADGSGAVLVGRSTGGAIINIMRADGRPIEVLFEHLPTAAQRSAGATVTPTGEIVPPRAPRPANLDFSSWSQRQGAAPPTSTPSLQPTNPPSFDPYTAASNWLADTGLPAAGRMLERTSPGTQMLKSVADIRLPSWSQRAQQRYGRQPSDVSTTPEPNTAPTTSPPEIQRATFWDRISRPSFDPYSSNSIFPDFRKLARDVRLLRRYFAGDQISTPTVGDRIP